MKKSDMIFLAPNGKQVSIDELLEGTQIRAVETSNPDRIDFSIDYELVNSLLPRPYMDADDNVGFDADYDNNLIEFLNKIDESMDIYMYNPLQEYGFYDYPREVFDIRSQKIGELYHNIKVYLEIVTEPLRVKEIEKMADEYLLKEASNIHNL